MCSQTDNKKGFRYGNRNLYICFEPKDTYIENVRNIKNETGGCTIFRINDNLAAVALFGEGGRIAIIDALNPEHLSSGVTPCIINGSDAIDFQWDPFDPFQLAVGCLNGWIKFWKIPNDGLKVPTNISQSEFKAHIQKVTIIRYNPSVKGIILSSGNEEIKIWSLLTKKENLVCLKEVKCRVFDCDWSSNGSLVAAAFENCIQILEPNEAAPIQQRAPIDARFCKICWVNKMQFIICSELKR